MINEQFTPLEREYGSWSGVESTVFFAKVILKPGFQYSFLDNRTSGLPSDLSLPRTSDVKIPPKESTVKIMNAVLTPFIKTVWTSGVI